jgi:hypothetical protein
MRSTKEIEFDLLENGLDFIDNSLKPILESKNNHDLKYSVLHISAGTELILKEILRTEHWSLIFENIDSANFQKLRTGDFQSASFETIIYRLENIAAIEISESAKRYIRELRKKRNRIEHFAFKEIDSALKSNVSKVLSHVLEIIKENLDIKKYSKKSQNLFRDILKKSAKFHEFTSLTNAKLKSRLEELQSQNVRLFDCPECFQHTLPLNEELECLFCGYQDSPENVAYTYIENIWGLNEYSEVKDGGYFPLENCPTCEQRTLLVKDDTFLCFSCAKEWKSDELRNCDWCNRLYEENDGDWGMCEDCKEERMEKLMNDD